MQKKQKIGDVIGSRAGDGGNEQVHGEASNLWMRAVGGDFFRIAIIKYTVPKFRNSRFAG
jgi:hypothetical protein